MLRSIVLASGIVAFGAAGAWASPLTDKYSSFWVFGDSLSDDGNLFAASEQPPAPYFQGRFSDGPVWNEGIQKEFRDAGKFSDNFAFGGATAVTNGDAIPDLSLQLMSFGASVPQNVLGDRPLASLWFGANDILDTIAANAAATDVVAKVSAAALAAANAVGDGARSLVQRGFEDFAIWNLPDIGQTPRFASFLPDAVGDLASFATEVFNTQLQQVIADLRAENLRVAQIDTAALFAEVLADPLTFGFTDTALPCLFPDAGTAAAFNRPQFCGDATGKLYFDSIHPTAQAHAILSDTFANTVAAVPLPSTGLLLAFGIAALALRRRAA